MFCSKLHLQGNTDYQNSFYSKPQSSSLSDLSQSAAKTPEFGHFGFNFSLQAIRLKIEQKLSQIRVFLLRPVKHDRLLDFSNLVLF